jgi:hypothetical protein
LNNVCNEKLTNDSAWYCDHDEMVLLNAHGVKYHSGADDCTVPCWMRHTMAATMMAKKRLLNTQNVALGNFPVGLWGVASYVESMMSSCMMPHTK